MEGYLKGLTTKQEMATNIGDIIEMDGEMYIVVRCCDDSKVHVLGLDGMIRIIDTAELDE